MCLIFSFDYDSFKTVDKPGTHVAADERDISSCEFYHSFPNFRPFARLMQAHLQTLVSCIVCVLYFIWDHLVYCHSHLNRSLTVLVVFHDWKQSGEASGVASLWWIPLQYLPPCCCVVSSHLPVEQLEALEVFLKSFLSSLLNIVRFLHSNGGWGCVVFCLVFLRQIWGCIPHIC